MQQITGYLYNRWIECLIQTNNTLTSRKPAMYAMPITVYQNIDNPLQFVFRDQDQKRVSISGFSLTLNIIVANSSTANQVVKTSTTVVAVNDGSPAEIAITNGTTNSLPLIEIPLVVLDNVVDPKTKGLASVTIPAAALAGLCPDDYWYSVKAVNGQGVSAPAFIDGNYNARGTLKLIGGIF